MRNKSLDYDQIAADYNRRYQNDRRLGTLNALRAILSEIAPIRILEVGCGTCHWLEGLQASGLSLMGVDKSYAMLKQARALQKTLLCQAAAESLPLKDESYDFIYCVNALHHFSEPQTFIREVQRVLMPGGTLAIIGMDPSDTRNRWYLYDFFTGVFENDLERFPDWNRVKYWVKQAPFSLVQFNDVVFIHDPKTRDSVLQDPFLQKNACSQLALLSQEEYKRGLAQLQAHVNTIQDPGFCYENDIVLSMLRARK